VHDFESCKTGKDSFHHQQHLVVATYYLQTAEVEAATARMRSALFRFLEHHNIDTQKYNETLTIFWVEMVARELKKLAPDKTLAEKCNSVIAALSNAKLALDFYSDELLWSDEARARFVEPDVQRWK
ncbi:MAG TPA: hypothetical protein VF251_08425, partial [Pyrinomonadaceae bacterium]